MSRRETIELTTEGGLTGRGVGNLRVEGDTLFLNGQRRRQITEAEGARLDLLTGTLPQVSRRKERPPDGIRYQVRVGDQSVSWTDADFDRLPDEIRRLFAALWNMRA